MEINYSFFKYIIQHLYEHWVETRDVIAQWLIFERLVFLIPYSCLRKYSNNYKNILS